MERILEFEIDSTTIRSLASALRRAPDFASRALRAYYMCSRPVPMTPKRESAAPSDAEWRVLNALWRKHPASARDLLDALASDRRWAYTTLKTILTRMEQKGLVRMEMRGNTASYEPAIEQQRAQRHALSSLIERVFEGAAGPLLAQLVDDERLSAADRRKLASLADDVEAKERKRGGR
jgi:BlaI family penicillinase repressor